MPQIFFVAVFCLLISACSQVELAYRNADRIILHQAHQMVDANAAQRDHWEPQLVKTLHRHRAEELPLVVDYLQLAGHIIEQSGQKGGGACLLSGAILVYERHARLAVELAVPLLLSLDGAQIEHLKQYLAQRQEDAISRYLDPDPARRKAIRLERFVDRIEAWTGKLNNDQREQIGDAVERIPDLSASWLIYREQQSERLLGMLETGVDENNLRNFLMGWWVKQSGRSASNTLQWSTAKRELILLVDELVSTLTSRQRSRILSRLGNIREDLAAFLDPSHSSLTLSSTIPACTYPPV